MKNKNFMDLWNLNFPFMIPLGYRFRTCFKERWVRVHSLPNGKRYPDNKSEEQEVLFRQNQILNDLMRGTRVYLLIASYEYSSPGFPKGYQNCLSIKEFGKLPSVRLDQVLPEKYEDKVYLKMAVSPIKWNMGRYDNLLRKVMFDKVGDILFVNFSKMIVTYPYDGGMDLIFKNKANRLSIKRKYKGWIAKNL